MMNAIRSRSKRLLLTLLGITALALTAGAEPAAGKPVITLSQQTYRVGETIEVSIRGLPGNGQDWVTVVQADTADTRWGEWKYTGGVNEGTWAFNARNPGRYEVRVYFDYPAGGFKVHARAPLTVEQNAVTAPHPATAGQSRTGSSTCKREASGVPRYPPRGATTTLYGEGRWEHGRGATQGYASLVLDPQDDGSVFAWLDGQAASNEFKLYSQVTAVAIFADSKGRILRRHDGAHDVSVMIDLLAMAMGNNVSRKRRQIPMRFPPGCDVTYALMKFRFCSFKESFERRNVATSCPGKYGYGAGNRTLRNIDLSGVELLEQELGTGAFKVGQKFELPGEWQGIRLK